MLWGFARNQVERLKLRMLSSEALESMAPVNGILQLH
jgi:hypothetical protein